MRAPGQTNGGGVNLRKADRLAWLRDVVVRAEPRLALPAIAHVAIWVSAALLARRRSRAWLGWERMRAHDMPREQTHPTGRSGTTSSRSAGRNAEAIHDRSVDPAQARGQLASLPRRSGRRARTLARDREDPLARDHEDPAATRGGGAGRHPRRRR